MDALAVGVLGGIALVLGLSAVLGGLASRCGQPRVVGQLLAGVVLGPSLLGRLPGHLTGHLFPAQVLPVLAACAQLGVVIFMFVVGYEFDTRLLRGHGRAVPLVALSALAVPMALGCGAVLVLWPMFAVVGQPLRTSLVLFVGVALAITALPVLAAIVRERGLSATRAGFTATGAAAIMDVVAWLVLAAVLASAQHQTRWPWPETLLVLACFVMIMLGAVRPALRWWCRRPGALLHNQLIVPLVLALGSAWVTASLGLHPAFGGFLAGVTMRGVRGVPEPDVLRPMEEVSGLLLPLFLAVTGLSLNIGNLTGAAFGLLALICVIACAGKIGPAYLAARLGGLEPSESATVAVLMNTRGLTELIVLNVGLTAHLIGPRLFTILVLMALIMTAAAGPLLALIRPPSGPAAAPRPGERFSEVD